MASLSYEDLAPSTHDEVRRLVLAGLSEHWGAVDESLNPDLHDMLESYSSGRTVVARSEGGEIVGTGTVVPRGGQAAEVLRMSVHRGARRTGVGRRIVDELAATARGWGCDELVLETSSAWTEVVAFYESCGFTITHLEDGPYGSDTWLARGLTSPD